MIFIAVKFAIRPDVADQWLARIAPFTAATRAEPGNVFFEWSRSVDRPNQFVLLEAFRDRAAGEVHVHSAHFQEAMAWMPDVVAAAHCPVTRDAVGARLACHRVSPSRACLGASTPRHAGRHPLTRHALQSKRPWMGSTGQGLLWRARPLGGGSGGARLGPTCADGPRGPSRPA